MVKNMDKDNRTFTIALRRCFRFPINRYSSKWWRLHV